jgi:hypothetical protein
METEVFDGKEITQKVCDKLAKVIIETLFEFDIKPAEELTDEEYNMKLVALYRGMLTTVISKPFLDVVDGIIKSKFKE